MLCCAKSQSARKLWPNLWGMRDLLKADGFDDAIIGMCQVHEHVYAYDYEKCIEVLQRDQGFTYLDSVEYMDFNVAGAYVGRHTPVFVHIGETEEDVIDGATRDYSRQHNFNDFATTSPASPLPGQQVDNELNAVKLTLDDLNTNIGIIQRDDGKIRNQSVHKDAFDVDALALISSGNFNLEAIGHLVLLCCW